MCLLSCAPVLLMSSCNQDRHRIGGSFRGTMGRSVPQNRGVHDMYPFQSPHAKLSNQTSLQPGGMWLLPSGGLRPSIPMACLWPSSPLGPGHLWAGCQGGRQSRTQSSSVPPVAAPRCGPSATAQEACKQLLITMTLEARSQQVCSSCGTVCSRPLPSCWELLGAAGGSWGLLEAAEGS